MNEKSSGLNKLLSYREQIESILAEMEAILQVYFCEEYSVADQHWLPQIKTALRDNLKYLPRGQYTMDYTVGRVEDKLFSKNDKGVSKYI